MLEEKDQILLLQLFAASVLFLNVKTEQGNPFVKRLNSKNEEKALAILTDAVNNLEHLLPMLQQMDEELKDAFEPSVSVENKEVIDLEKYK